MPEYKCSECDATGVHKCKDGRMHSPQPPDNRSPEEVQADASRAMTIDTKTKAMCDNFERKHGCQRDHESYVRMEPLFQSLEDAAFDFSTADGLRIPHLGRTSGTMVVKIIGANCTWKRMKPGDFDRTFQALMRRGAIEVKSTRATGFQYRPTEGGLKLRAAVLDAAATVLEGGQR